MVVQIPFRATIVVLSSYDNGNNRSNHITLLDGTNDDTSCIIGHGSPCECYKYLLYGGHECSQSYRDAVYDAFLPTTLVFAFFLFYLTVHHIIITIIYHHIISYHLSDAERASRHTPSSVRHLTLFGR